MIFRRAFLVAALFSIIASAGFATDCYMGRYSPDQRGYTSEKLPLPIALLWECTGSKYENNPASPIVVGKLCFWACGDRVYATDLQTGNIKWKYPSDQPIGGAIKSTPAYADGKLYFGSGDGSLYCLDAAKGTFQWAYQTRGSIRCAPVVDQGTVYVGSDDNSLYAINADTGELAWNRFSTRDDVAVGVAIGAGMAVVSSMDGNLYGVNAGSGKLRWMYRMPMAPIKTSPIIVENTTIMSIGSTLYGITARSGQLRWTVDMTTDITSTPASDGACLYVTCADKKIYAYNLTGRKPALKWAEPADIGVNLMSSPVVAGEVLYVAGSKGVLAAISAADGSVKWRYMVSPAQSSGMARTDAASSPTVANGMLLCVTDDGVLHCFKSGAPDSESPVLYDKKPRIASIIPAAPPFKISAVLYDIGSGVDFSNTTISLDGMAVDYKLDYAQSSITAIFDKGPDGKPVKKLLDGAHTVILNSKDYAGNTFKEEWSFYADSSLQPPKRKEETGKKTIDTKNRSRKTSEPEPTPEPEQGGGAPPPPPPPGP